MRSLVSAKHKIEKQTASSNIEIILKIIKMFKKLLFKIYYHNNNQLDSSTANDKNKLINFKPKSHHENVDEDSSSLPSRK